MLPHCYWICRLGKDLRESIGLCHQKGGLRLSLLYLWDKKLAKVNYLLWRISHCILLSIYVSCSLITQQILYFQCILINATCTTISRYDKKMKRSLACYIVFNLDISMQLRQQSHRDIQDSTAQAWKMIRCSPAAIPKQEWGWPSRIWTSSVTARAATPPARPGAMLIAPLASMITW